MRNARLKFILQVCVALFAIALSAAGQTTSPQDTSADTEKVAKIKEMLKLSHALDNATKLMHQSMDRQKKLLPFPPAAQDDFERIFFEEFKVERMIDLAIPAYAKAFTSDELDQIINFYKTPIGQKVLEKSPELMQTLAAEGAELGKQAGMKAAVEIDRKLKAGEYGPWPPEENKTPTAAKPE